MLNDAYVYIDDVFMGIFDFNNKESMGRYLDLCKKNVGKSITIKSDEIEGGSMDVVFRWNGEE